MKPCLQKQIKYFLSPAFLTQSQRVLSRTHPTLPGKLLPHARKAKPKWRTERQERLLFRPHPLQNCRDGEFVSDQKLEKEVFSVFMKLLAKQEGPDRL